jgi:protein SCO1/2
LVRDVWVCATVGGKEDVLRKLKEDAMKVVEKFLVAAFLSSVVVGPGKADTQSAVHPEIGIVEKLGETVSLDEEFYDESGHIVRLKQVINKPTIVTFVYYRCSGICSPLLTELAGIVEKMDLELGKDYQILTLSFDPSEKPELAASKRENYLSAIAKPVNAQGWRFFTGDSANIHRFTDAAGFYYKPHEKDWVHPTALIFLSPEGKVTRYINGIQYLPFDVKMAVIEASNGKVGPTIARILRLCYSYDPEGHTYALNITRIGMVATLVLVAVFVAVFVLRPRKTAKGA